MTHQQLSFWTIAAALGAFVLAMMLYLRSGTPTALHAADGTSAATAMLERHLERSPRDGRAWVMLARLEFERDRFGAAAHAYERALDISGKVRRDPQIWCELADALGMEQGGSLGGRPRSLIGHALSLDPGHPRALEMAGSAAIESLDYGAAAQYWKRLLKQLESGSPDHAKLELALERLRGLAARGSPAAGR